MQGWETVSQPHRATCRSRSVSSASTEHLEMGLESRKEPGRREAEAGFNFEDTFAASVEEFDSLIADAQGLCGLKGRGGRGAGGTEMLPRSDHPVSREDCQHRDRVLAGEAWSIQL